MQPNFFFALFINLFFGSGVCKLWSSFTRIIDFVSHKANPKELFSCSPFHTHFYSMCTIFRPAHLTSFYFNFRLKCYFQSNLCLLSTLSLSPLAFQGFFFSIFLLSLHNKVKWPLVVGCYILETFTRHSLPLVYLQ